MKYRPHAHIRSLPPEGSECSDLQGKASPGATRREA
jgi:hypothetical protein